jgi:ribosomal protein L12E/L44/L45/RPP1/RPP2
MAKKTRKVLKQESQQRAIQQAKANVSAADAAPVQAAAPAPAAPERAAKLEQEEAQEFAYVKSDVRRSLLLAAIFAVAMIALSFIVR